jgi:glutaredoxin 3
MSSVRVYVTSYCPYCTMAKGHLERLGVAYQTIDVSHDPETRNWLVERTGMRTVPQIFVGDTPVGGYTDMMAMERSGEFRPLLEREGVVRG